MKKFLLLFFGVFGIFTTLKETIANPLENYCSWNKAVELTQKDYNQIVKAFKEKYSMHYNGSGIVVNKKVKNGKYYLLVAVVRPCSEINKKENIVCKLLPNCIKLQVPKDIFDFVEYSKPNLVKVDINKWISLGLTEIDVKNDTNTEYINCKDLKYIIDGKLIETSKLQICNF
jgi:hypothetical protein